MFHSLQSIVGFYPSRTDQSTPLNISSVGPKIDIYCRSTFSSCLVVAVWQSTWLPSTFRKKYCLAWSCFPEQSAFSSSVAFWSAFLQLSEILLQFFMLFGEVFRDVKAFMPWRETVRTLKTCPLSVCIRSDGGGTIGQGRNADSVYLSLPVHTAIWRWIRLSHWIWIWWATDLSFQFVRARFPNAQDNTFPSAYHSCIM